MKRRVNLLNEVREAVGVKNMSTFDGRIYAMYKGKSIIENQRKISEKC